MIVFAWRWCPLTSDSSQFLFRLKSSVRISLLYFSLHPSQVRFRILVLISNACLSVYWLICNKPTLSTSLPSTRLYSNSTIFCLSPHTVWGEILAREGRIESTTGSPLTTECWRRASFKLLLREDSVWGQASCGITTPSTAIYLHSSTGGFASCLIRSPDTSWIPRGRINGPLVIRAIESYLVYQTLTTW